MIKNYTKTAKPNQHYFGDYPRYFRMQVHQLIAWGYQDALSVIRSNNEEETAITGFITEAIENRFLTNSLKWLNHYFVKDDPPVKREGSSGRSRPRSDIIIQANFKGRPEYTFEAKRLRDNGYGTNKYIGPEGMGRFVNCLYAPRYNEAGMLGYIQSDSLIIWKNKVKKAIDYKSKPICLISTQRDQIVINEFPLEWTSEHERTKLGRSINIYHILLDCQITG